MLYVGQIVNSISCTLSIWYSLYTSLSQVIHEMVMPLSTEWLSIAETQRISYIKYKRKDGIQFSCIKTGIYSNFPAIIKFALQNQLTQCGLNDIIWPHRPRSRLPQKMACCLSAPSNYMNRYWSIISTVKRHSFEDNFARNISLSGYEIPLRR